MTDRTKDGPITMDPAASRMMAATALRERARRKRAEADGLDALAVFAETLPPKSHAELALWDLAMRREP